MKHVNDSALRKDSSAMFPFSDDAIMSQASGAPPSDENRENHSK